MDNLKEQFDHQLSGIAWSLWKEMGIAGIDRFHENCLVQPEELIILTAIISEYDPRLRDEALDWCSRYHEWISVSRLRTLLKGLPIAEHSFSQFVAALNSTSSAKWPLAAEGSIFKFKLSGKSFLPSLEAPSLLTLRVRSLFGPGVKADVLTSLLTRSELNFSAADLAEIGYSKRSVMTALDHLAGSGIVTTTHVRNTKSYKLKKIRELQVVLGKLPKSAPPWNKILQALTAIRTIIPEVQKSSVHTKSVILRNCLSSIKPLLPTLIAPILYKKPDFEQDWKDVMGILIAFQQGNFLMHYEVYNEFDKVVSHLMQYLYKVDDCVDGIDTIQDEIEYKTKRHAEVYKECYQLFLSFVGDLEASLKQFIEFPFHKMMDESLADITYKFSQKELPQLLNLIKQIKPIDQITNVQSAMRQYQMFMLEFKGLKQFIYTFKNRLKDLYFVKTDINLLKQPDVLYKRHLVFPLFSLDPKY